MRPAHDQIALVRPIKLWVLGVLFVLLPQLITAAPTLDDQRKDFAAAERAYALGRLSDYRAIAARLTEYPLYPYLRYHRLSRNISPAKSVEIEQFLADFGELPIAQRLRERWLGELARTNAWQKYVDAYQHSVTVSLQCHYHRALMNTGNKAQAWRGARDLWLHGKSRPKACDSLFSAWRKSDEFTSEVVWQRVRLALAAGQPRLAGYLTKMLPDPERLIGEQMVAVHRRPNKIVSCDFWEKPELAPVVAHGLRRLARKDAGLALSVWESRASKIQFDPVDRGATLNRLALELALSDDPDAESFLDGLPAGLLDETASEWRMRWALGAGKWQRLLQWYDQLEELPQESTRWRYWRARALQAEGEQLAASTIYSELAGERDYYGFLAADQLGKPYQFQQQALVVDPVELKALADSPAMRRIVELRHFGRETDARREWWYSLRGASNEQRQVAAKLAQQWNWYSLAVLTAASAKSWNDLELRFPLNFKEIIGAQAQVQQLPVELVYGLIRRESIFDVNARSRVGARGLMQLMPATAKRVARSRNERWRSISELSRPETNIRYGSHYLRQMLDRFEGHKALALAAYNGGPHNVTRWLKRYNSAPADLWTEMITFGETREYVQAVLSYAIIYRELTGETPLRLADLAPTVSLPLANTPPAVPLKTAKSQLQVVQTCPQNP